MPKQILMSARQVQVIALVAEGLSDKEIAVGLGLSTSTVKTYLSRLYRTHGLKNRAHAAGLYARLHSDGLAVSRQGLAFASVDPNGVSLLPDSRMPDL